MLFKKSLPYPVHIHPSDNGGYIVQVGCQQRVYNDRGALVLDLQEYLARPKEVVLQYSDAVKAGEMGDIGCGATATGPMTETEDLHITVAPRDC